MWKYRLRLWFYQIKKIFFKEKHRKVEQFIYEYDEDKDQ